MNDDEARALVEENERLKAAITEHHAQKADDRCIEDDDKLYAAAGLPPCDRRVGDKAAMLKNCERFIERRCQGGGWPTYAQLENLLHRIMQNECIGFSHHMEYEKLYSVETRGY